MPIRCRYCLSIEHLMKNHKLLNGNIEGGHGVALGGTTLGFLDIGILANFDIQNSRGLLRAFRQRQDGRPTKRKNVAMDNEPSIPPIDPIVSIDNKQEINN